MFPQWVNLPLVFVLLTVGTGLVVAAEKFYFRKRRVPGIEGSEQLPVLVDVSQSFFPLLFVILVLRSFVFEPYRIPSESMLPTLLIGDFVVVSKYSYGLRLPVVNSKIFDTGTPQRGDVAVFRKPGSPNINFIKRVIGVPGDVISYQNHVLTVNGERTVLTPAGRFTNDNNDGALYRETFDDDGHTILVQSSFTRPFEYVVEEGCFFMMGDNRDRSKDSRFSEVGCVPEENLVGRATRIWLSWKLWDMPRWSRIGDKIQ
ncbi:MAG: signal peptidase I [Pseudomonadota bacterium]